MNNDNILLLATLEPCWLWWLILSALAFILGALLGWLLFGNRKRVKELEEENASLHGKLTTMEKDFMGLKYQHEELEKEATTLRAKLNSCQADLSVAETRVRRLKAEMEALKAGEEGEEGTGSEESGSGDVRQKAFGAPIVGGGPRDDLKRIEGIGPKVEQLLNDDGIMTFKGLAEASVERLQGILAKAGGRYRIVKPGTWPKQAGLADAGKWDELKEYQDRLQGGIDPDERK